jgi:hypothetical protein
MKKAQSSSYIQFNTSLKISLSLKVDDVFVLLYFLLVHLKVATTTALKAFFSAWDASLGSLEIAQRLQILSKVTITYVSSLPQRLVRWLT